MRFLLILLAIAVGIYSAAYALDGIGDDCDTIIIGSPPIGFTCDDDDPCPGDTACNKVSSTGMGETIETCACQNNSITECCAYYWVTVGADSFAVPEGDCDPPNSACDWGTCRNYPIPTPIGQPHMKKAVCLPDAG